MKEYYGEFCVTARIAFATTSEKEIEEVKQEILNMGFGITLYNEENKEVPKDKFEIVEMEGQIIDEPSRGNVRELYTNGLEIYEEE